MKNLNDKVIYNITIRAFTPAGTLKAAEERIGHIASLNIDYLYLGSTFVQSDDEDCSTWSERQIKSGFGNPKNPYKIKDYFHVDEEYGTDEDLKSFIDTAHRYGLKVLLDLVYLHCDKNAVFVKEHPDFVKHNPDGSILVGENWPFARINYESNELREYLWENMITFIRDYDADGYRVDCGDWIPLDFWAEGVRRIREIKPDAFMLNEGCCPEYLDGVFNLDYSGRWPCTMIDVFGKGESAGAIREAFSLETDEYGERRYRLIRNIDNHDYASDAGTERNEKLMTTRGVEAALLFNHTFEGVPFIWCGYEFCDDAVNCMLSNRFYGRCGNIDWSYLGTERGQKRMRFMREINDMRHRYIVFADGNLNWTQNDNQDSVLSFVRKCPGQSAEVVVNTKNAPVTVTVSGGFETTEALRQSGCVKNGNVYTLEPYGYYVGIGN